MIDFIFMIPVQNEDPSLGPRDGLEVVLGVLHDDGVDDVFGVHPVWQVRNKFANNLKESRVRMSMDTS